MCTAVCFLCQCAYAWGRRCWCFVSLFLFLLSDWMTLVLDIVRLLKPLPSFSLFWLLNPTSLLSEFIPLFDFLYEEVFFCLFTLTCSFLFCSWGILAGGRWSLVCDSCMMLFTHSRLYFADVYLFLLHVRLCVFVWLCQQRLPSPSW